MNPDRRPDATDDETQLRQLLPRLMAGWNAEDAEAFASVFTDDATFVAFDGTTLRGRRHIAAFHRPLFKTHLKGMRLLGRVDELRFLSPEVASLLCVGSTTPPGQATPAAQRDSVQTLVAVKRAGQWALAAFQNTRLRPIEAGAGFVAWMLADASWRLLGTRGPSLLAA
jgi:uncharacterized protein (TIGR02246 family)